MRKLIIITIIGGLLLLFCQKNATPDLSDEKQTVAKAVTLINDPHQNPIEKQIEYFYEFHGLLHLIYTFMEEKQLDALGQTLPFLDTRFKKLMFEEGWLGLENKDYRYRLAQLDKAVVDFSNAYKLDDFASMRRRYKEMHNAYSRLLDNRPAEQTQTP
jgi:hypothetical protein